MTISRHDTLLSSASRRGALLDAESFVGNERFVVERRLGAGAFGVVYEAFDRQEQATVALKVLRFNEADALYRFKKGFRSLADLRHPNLVSFYELLTDQGQWFFSMELVDGVDFIEALWGRGEARKRPSVERIRSVTLQLALGLEAVHLSGRLHRDIKPPNVLVTAEDHVKLLDFGLVAELELGRRQSGIVNQQMIGTPAYMAPEQANGDAGSPASDWYSVGVMLYQALTDELPFAGTLIQILQNKLRPQILTELKGKVFDLPEDLANLCLQLLQPLPERRPTGAEVIDRLGAKSSSNVSAPAFPLDGSGPTAERTFFVGRRAQIGELAEALEISERRVVVFYLRGPSGIGKSALIRHFLGMVEEREQRAIVLYGRCFFQESVPYKALDSLIDALSRFLTALPDDEAADLAPDELQTLTRLFPVLLRVPSFADACRRQRIESDDPQIVRRQAVAALRDLLARVAQKYRLVLAIDDLQWGDLDSFLLLDELLKTTKLPHFLFIGSYRSEDEGSGPFLRSLAEQRRHLRRRGLEVRQLDLQKLEDDDALELLRHQVTPESGFDEARLAELVRDADGSPLFLSELARWAGQEAARGIAPNFSKADTAVRVRDLILLRLGNLSTPALSLLEVVAVAGKPVDLAAVREASLLHGDAIAALAELRKSRLVRLLRSEGREEIETYHDRIREAVISRLVPEELSLRHRRLALALESSGRADPETLAVHFQATQEAARARLYILSAAARAEEALAFDRAARLYQLALDQALDKTDERAETQIKLAAALANAGHSRDAADTYLRAVGESSLLDPFDMQRHAAEKLLISGHIDRGMAVLRHVLRTVGLDLDSHNWQSLLRLWFLRLRLRWHGFDFVERDPVGIDPGLLRRIDVCWTAEVGLGLVDVLHASEFHARHLLLALKAGDRQRIARGLAMEVFFGSMHALDPAETLQQARDLAGRAEGHYASSLTEMAAGMVACSRGEWRRAQRRLARAEDLLRENRHGVVWELDTLLQFRTLTLLHLGRWQELFDESPQLFERARVQGDLYLEVHLHHWVECWRLLVRDAPLEAQRAFDTSVGGWTRHGFHYQHFGRLYAEVSIALYQGEGVVAWEAIERCWEMLQNSMLQRIEMVHVQSYDLRGRAALMALIATPPGKARERLRQELTRATERVGQVRSSWASGLASVLAAGLAAFEARSEESRRCLEAAEAAFDACEMALHRLLVKRRLASLSGDHEARVDSRGNVREIAEIDAALRDEGVVRPDRLADVLVPLPHARRV